MRFKNVFIFSAVFLFLSVLFPKNSWALADCSSSGIDISISGLPNEIIEGESFTLALTGNKPGTFEDGKEYQIESSFGQWGWFSGHINEIAHDNSLVVTITPDATTRKTGVHGAYEDISLRLANTGLGGDICKIGFYRITKSLDKLSIIGLKIKGSEGYECIGNEGTGYLNISGVVMSGSEKYDGGEKVCMKLTGFPGNPFKDRCSASIHDGGFAFAVKDPFFEAGHNYGVELSLGNFFNTNQMLYKGSFAPKAGACTEDDQKFIKKIQSSNVAVKYYNPLYPDKCGEGQFEGIKTALGCIPTSANGFVAWFFKLAISLGGGIAFLMLAGGGYIFMTSQGNPEQIKKGQQLIFSALSGLLMIILATFLLRLIGHDILQIPGFK